MKKEISPEQSLIITKCVELRKQGLSYAKIAKTLNVSNSFAAWRCRDVILTEEQKKQILKQRTSSTAGKCLKPLLKEQARDLRKTGLSIKLIAKQLKVTTGSVRKWTTDIELKIQRTHLNRDISINRLKATCIKKRRKAQLEGRQLAKENDVKYAFGCALFLAEGEKSQNTIQFTNSDPDIILFYMQFLKTYFNINPNQTTIVINYYETENLSYEEIKTFWKNLIGVTDNEFRKQQKRNRYYKIPEKIKYPYGICRITVCSTELVQKLYGSIKEYMGIYSNKWIYINKK